MGIALDLRGLSAQCGVEAGAQVGLSFGGFVGEDQAQVPAAAGPPAIHRGGGDLGASEQPPGCLPRIQAHAAGVDEQRPAAVRADARIPGELVQDQCVALLPDPGSCGGIGADPGWFRAAATACWAIAESPAQRLAGRINEGPGGNQPGGEPVFLTAR